MYFGRKVDSKYQLLEVASAARQIVSLYAVNRMKNSYLGKHFGGAEAPSAPLPLATCLGHLLLPPARDGNRLLFDRLIGGRSSQSTTIDYGRLIDNRDQLIDYYRLSLIYLAPMIVLWVIAPHAP